MIVPPCGNPAPPTQDPASTSPAGDAAASCPQCVYWNQRHQLDFSGADTKFTVSTQAPSATVAFRTEADLAAGAIIVTSIFKWGTVASTITTAERAATITQFKSLVASWGGRCQLKIVDPICGEKTLPIRFRLLWSPDDVPDSTSYRVNLVRNDPRAGVAGWNINIGYNDVTQHGGWVLAHEYGHTLGLHDEYFYNGVTSATVTYKKADGSSDVITLEPSSGNIMFTHSNTRYLNRFYYFVAIQAQELLRTESGRSVTCEIV